MTSNQHINSILSFWFEVSTPTQWYRKNAEFDAAISEQFGVLIERGLNGQLDDWAAEPDGCLALIILLDQFTRNVFRDTPRAFAGDEIALALSLKAHRSGWIDAEPDMARRQFYLMPMMHAEDLDVQDASLELFERLTNEHTHHYAILHRDIIARFGHFPHRNAILGRPSTDEEISFLQEPNSSF